MERGMEWSIRVASFTKEINSGKIGEEKERANVATKMENAE